MPEPDPRRPRADIPIKALEDAFFRIYIGEERAGFRQEDHKKIQELKGLLATLVTALPRRTGHLVLVDAAAGKAFLGLLAAELVFAPRGMTGDLLLLERNPHRVDACRQAIARTRAPGWNLRVQEADVAEGSVWPETPDAVFALHACGPASDAILDAAIQCRAKRLFLVPCCTSHDVLSAPLGEAWHKRLGIPTHAEVRRRFLQAIVDSERTLRLEAAGYETTVVPFAPPTVTPHNLLWRSLRVGEPGRMQAASERLKRLLSVPEIA